MSVGSESPWLALVERPPYDGGLTAPEAGALTQESLVGMLCARHLLCV